LRIDGDGVLGWQHLDGPTPAAAFQHWAIEDRTFKPTIDRATSPWHATVRGNERQPLLAGRKFSNTPVQMGDVVQVAVSL
jgi:hypothetical protein